MHGALTAFGGFELDVRWEQMQRQAFGNDTFEEMLAQREEENIAKELSLKAFKILQKQQGLSGKAKVVNADNHRKNLRTVV